MKLNSQSHIIFIFLVLCSMAFTACNNQEKVPEQTTVRELYLCRHAKAKSMDINQEDIDRKLTSKGKQSAKLLGTYLSKQPKPDLIVCSASKRAEATARNIAKAVGYPVMEIQRKTDLYKCPTHNLLAFVRHLPDSVQRVCIVLHNPTIEQAVNHYQKDTLIQKVKPASLVHIRFDIALWADATHKTGVFQTLNHFKVTPPKDEPL